MAIFKSLKTLLKNPSNTRSLLTLCASPTPFPSPSPPLSLFTTSFILTTPHSRFLSPLSRWTPFSGPLFLSSPPWQLSQLATPLYSQGEAILRKAENWELKLIERKKRFLTNFRCPSVASVSRLGNVVDQKELHNGGVDESFFNLPNLISISRLVSGPFLGWMIMNEWYLSAFLGLAVSGATDWLDGYMARKMGINSVIGSYLDPLADKVLIGSVALAMVKMDLLPSWLVGLVVFRDVGLISGAFYKRASALNWEWKSWSEFTNLNGTRPQKVEPLFISKVNTVFQLVLVAAALLQPEFGSEETQVYITYLSWLVALTTVASTAAYGAQHMRDKSMLVTKRSFPGTKSQ